MSAEVRNVVLVVVVVLIAIVGWSRWSLHVDRMEWAARDRAEELRKDRVRVFRERCATLGGRVMFSCPDVCVKLDALVEVMQ